MEGGERKTSEDIDVTAIYENKWVSELFHKQIFDYVKFEFPKDKYLFSMFKKSLKIPKG